jgi:hypothetical protein
LPPSSNDNGFTCGAADFMISVPVRVSPVNVSASMPGCLATNSPALSGPKPCTTENAPAGTPASFITSASSVAVEGVSSDGFRMTELPHAIAGAIFQVESSSGRFQGEITPTTPCGSRIE